MSTVEEFSKSPRKMMEKLEAIITILRSILELHGDKQGGFDFRPQKVFITAQTATFSPLNLAEMDSDYVKYHHEEAICALLYAAPETIRGTGLTGVDDLQRADIWGFGCLMLYIMSEAHPQHYAVLKNQEKRCLNNEQNPFLAITLMAASGKSQPDYLEFCGNNSTLIELFCSCFRFNPAERKSLLALRNDFLPACVTSVTAAQQNLGTHTSSLSTRNKDTDVGDVHQPSKTENNVSATDNTDEEITDDGVEITGNVDATEGNEYDDPVDAADKDGTAEVIGSNMQYRYSHTDCIGYGSFGLVYKAKVTKRGSYTGEQFVAVQLMHVPNDSLDADEKESWRNVLTKLRKFIELTNKHLVAYHKVSVTMSTGGAMIELAMDYHKGDLAGFLKATKKNAELRSNYTCRKIMKFTLHIARGLEFLHKNGIIHGDLKPKNILVKITENDREKLLISDFFDVMQMKLSHACSSDTSHRRGTIRYMSPEKLNKLFRETLDVPGRKTDIWSLGCIILEMAESLINVPRKRVILDGKVVEVGSDVSSTGYAHLIVDGYAPFVDGEIEESLARVIQQCLCRADADRISADALVRIFKIQKKPVVVFFAHPGHNIDQVLIFDPSTSSFNTQEVPGSPSAVREPYAVLAGPKSEMMLVQRGNTDAGLSDVFRFWNVREGKWREITPSRQSLFKEAIAVKHRVYLWDKMKSFVEMNAFTGRIVSLKAPPPRKAYHHDLTAVAKCDQHIFYATWDCLLRYDTKNHEWRSLPNLPEMRWDFAIGVINGYIYIIGGKVAEPVGGNTERSATADCIRLNLDAPDPAWETIQPLAQPRYCHAACVVQDRIYVCGGRYAAEQHALETESYDTKRDEGWSTVNLLEKDIQLLSNFAALIKPRDPWCGSLTAVTVDMESEIVIDFPG
ncbi:uncharacterized protein LOC129599244 isoform X2 [Paramacrobiotus metropolitanus]|uniref:uncharacterized protein LOC129599244 isoform X2 n=1 Tax=Paramacrobiotus metropolitanus TaxID=2943436 RepID=UPI0024456FAE|nr:uncharacterized protein LOC129599244 isoform X2 [Paramacrobiotus metropolitanus]